MESCILSADRLFDGTGAAAKSRPALLVRGDQIAAVERDRLPDGAGSLPRFDFPGCAILPGLIDTHVHLVFSADETNEAIVAQVSRESDEELLRRALANAQSALRAGLITLRDCGGKNRVVQEIRDRIRRGLDEGPDVLSCGMPITTPTGHCHWLGLTADGHDAAARAAERMLAEGADFLKVMATGGNMTPSSDPMRAQFDTPTLVHIADIGRSAGKHTAAHVLSRAGLPGAVAAQVRTIEHCDWRAEEDRYEFDPELARRIIDQGQFVGLTVSGTTRRAFLPQIANDRSGPVRRLDARFACERRMIDFGVPYTLHSDAGVRLTPIDRLDLGLRTAVLELGLTPAEALYRVTGAAAAALGLEDRGRIVPGRRADLLIVEGNPLADLACLQQIRAVMKAGRWVVSLTPLANNYKSPRVLARRSTASNIGSVSRPVNVFCWLGW